MEEDDTAQSEDAWETEKCCFCDNKIEQDPRLLRCLHSACGTCVADKQASAPEQDSPEGGSTGPVQSSGYIECPLCHDRSRVSFAIKNPFISEVRPSTSNETLPVRICMNCSDDNPADKFCVDCGEWLCVACVQAHQRVRVTKDHVLRETSECENTGPCLPPRVMYCTHHKTEQLSLFCETCDRLTCRDCQLKDHKDHRYKFTGEMAEVLRNELREKMESLRTKRAEFSEAQQLVEQRTKEVNDRHEQLTCEVEDFLSELAKVIQVRGVALMGTLDSITNKKKTVLSQWKEKISSLLLQSDHALRFLEMTLNGGSDTALLFTKRNVLHQIAALRQVDLNGEEIQKPIVVSFTKNGSENIVSALEKVGRISVDDLPLKSSVPRTISPAAKSQNRNQMQVIQGGSANPAATQMSVRMRVPMYNARPHAPHSPTDLVSSSTHPSPRTSPGVLAGFTYLFGGIVKQGYDKQRMPQWHGNGASPNQVITPTFSPGPAVPHAAVNNARNPIIDQMATVSNVRVDTLAHGATSNVAQPAGYRQNTTNYQVQPNVHVSAVPRRQNENPYNAVRTLQTMQRPVTPQGYAYQRQQQQPAGYSSSSHMLVQNASVAVQQRHRQQQLAQVVQQPGQRDQNIFLRPGIVKQTLIATGPAAAVPQRVITPTHAHPNRLVIQKTSSPHPATSVTTVANRVVDQSKGVSITVQHNPVNVKSEAIVDRPSCAMASGPPAQAPQPPQLSQSVTIRSVPQAVTATRVPGSSWHTPETSNPSMNAESFATNSQVDNSFKIRIGPSQEDEAKKRLSALGRHIKEEAGSLRASESVLEPELHRSMSRGSLDQPVSSSTGPEYLQGAENNCDIDPESNLRKVGELRQLTESPTPEYFERLLKDLSQDQRADDPAFSSESPEPLVPLGPPIDQCKEAVTLNFGPKKNWEVILHQTQTQIICTDGRGVLSVLTDKPGQSHTSEEWCSVCIDGGELVCCDQCPRVFHPTCHVPELTVVPKEDETWQCLMCRSKEYVKDTSMDQNGKRTPGLTASEIRIMHRILLELYCNPDSGPFLVPVDSSILTDYYDHIKEPMSLSEIKVKVAGAEKGDGYTDPSQFVTDVRLIFKNCYIYNDSMSPVYEQGKRVEESLENLLEEYIPQYAYDLSCSLDEANLPSLKKRRKKRKTSKENTPEPLVT